MLKLLSKPTVYLYLKQFLDAVLNTSVLGVEEENTFLYKFNLITQFSLSPNYMEL